MTGPTFTTFTGPTCEGTGAILSDARVYRYLLWRPVQRRPCARGGTVCFIGLNPSTADENANDPTIRREIGFAEAFGAERLVKVNAFAFRATDPKEMAKAAARGVDIVGPLNDAFLDWLPREWTVIAGWGSHPIMRSRQHDVVRLLGDRALFCLGTTADGSPRHPLYLKSDTALQPWRPRTAA